MSKKLLLGAISLILIIYWVIIFCSGYMRAISGVVLQSNGEAIEGAYVLASWEATQGFGQFVFSPEVVIEQVCLRTEVAVTDSNGEFLFSNSLLPDYVGFTPLISQYLNLAVYKPGFIVNPEMFARAPIDGIVDDAFDLKGWRNISDSIESSLSSILIRKIYFETESDIRTNFSRQTTFKDPNRLRIYLSPDSFQTFKKYLPKKDFLIHEDYLRDWRVSSLLSNFLSVFDRYGMLKEKPKFEKMKNASIYMPEADSEIVERNAEKIRLLRRLLAESSEDEVGSPMMNLRASYLKSISNDLSCDSSNDAVKFLKQVIEKEEIKGRKGVRLD